MNIEKMKCPGCGKHCPLSAPRCKFGRHYLEKMKEKPSADFEKNTKKKKWETYVKPGEAIWAFLSVSCQIKKALCKQKVTENQLLSEFSKDEIETMISLIKKFTVK
ncbi:MAG: hypothetical protein IJD39_08865 [Clostridia bacterium]|nr:hypothetical protein [Clostridia bacterium]